MSTYVNPYGTLIDGYQRMVREPPNAGMLVKVCELLELRKEVDPWGERALAFEYRELLTALRPLSRAIARSTGQEFADVWGVIAEGIMGNWLADFVEAVTRSGGGRFTSFVWRRVTKLFHEERRKIERHAKLEENNLPASPEVFVQQDRTADEPEVIGAPLWSTGPLNPEEAVELKQRHDILRLFITLSYQKKSRPKIS